MLIRTVFLAIFVTTSALEAQAPTAGLRVRVEGSPGVALPGALVALLGASDNVVAEGVAGLDGRRTLAAPGGSYRVRVRRIGYRPFISGGVTLPHPDELVLQVETQRVVLSTMVVSASFRCGAIDPNAQTLSAVWDEIAKALSASRLTTTDLAGIAFSRIYRMETDRFGKVTATDSSLQRVGANPPFGAVDAVVLAEKGYVIGDEASGWDHFGPDEVVLLSDQFAATHCFRLVRDAAHAGQIGVAFEPVPRRTVSDIKGVLWVDEGSSELRQIDFHYVNAGIFDRFNGGGFTHFRRMPSGAWIVDEWKLRMPRLQRFLGTGSLADTGPRIVVIGYIETGGGIIAPPERALRQ